MIMLRKAIRPKLLALFVVICTVGIIFAVLRDNTPYSPAVISD